VKIAMKITEFKYPVSHNTLFFSFCSMEEDALIANRINVSDGKQQFMKTIR